ncbi:MAG: acyl dehydratase [Magnetovibrio sp.]|nr:acyl dehydratase [Magnetovibrio sp.]
MQENSTGNFPRITDQGLEELEARKGMKITREPEPWCTEATRDNIRHYAHGIGDDNPLWCNPDYASGSAYGGIVALPSFIFSCSRIISGYVGGLPGVHAMWAGADFTWHKWIRRNDTIATESHLKDFIIRETKFSGRAVQQIYHVDFFNGDGDKVAEGDSWCFRTERDTAREKGTKYNNLKTQKKKIYTPSELTEIYRHYAEEEVRGATPRYAEDVTVGEKLPTMVKGPMTVTGFIAYAQGWGGLYIRANKLAWKQIHAHPGLGIPNRFNIPDCPERVHWENQFATDVGAPGAYDYGPERCSWMIHHLTNWMGDDGFLLHSETKIRHHNPVGDTLFINGEVTAVDGDLVTVAHEARNQDGALSIIGTGRVRLPSQAAK